MAPAFPFPQPQAPPKAETVTCPLCDGSGLQPGSEFGNCRTCCGVGTLPLLTLPEPRAFGWCGCTEALPCHEHERRTK